MSTEAVNLYSISHKEDTGRQSVDLKTNDGDWCER